MYIAVVNRISCLYIIIVVPVVVVVVVQLVAYVKHCSKLA